MKKNIPLFFILILISVFLSLDSCNKDNQEQIDPLVGKYIISSATLTQPLVFQGDTVLASGTDMTLAINAALLSSASCTSAANTRLELKNNGQIWYDCEGENKSIQNGTWEINSARTELSLALNIPQGTSTVTAQLKITGLSESKLKVSGSTTLPLPPEFFTAFGVDLTTSGVLIFQTSMHIEITRMP
jgi:hypothetical protein